MTWNYHENAIPKFQKMCFLVGSISFYIWVAQNEAAKN